MSSGELVSIRLKLEDADKIRDQLRQFGSAGEGALKKIEDAARRNVPAMKALNEVVGAGRDKINELSAAGGVLTSALGKMGAGWIAGAAALGGFVAIQRAAIREFAEAERINLRFNAVLKATGDVTGFTRGQLQNMAEEMSRSFAVDDDGIKAAMATLATFRTVSGEVFEGTLRAAQDLSVTFGGDLQSNTLALGKAMEMLAGGQADGLRKAFKALTVAQEDHIKQLAESGQTYQAQQELLNALRGSLGGTGEADAGPFR